MFKIFLKRQIHSNPKPDQKAKDEFSIQKGRKSERRSADRYEIKHGSLTFLNDFDMLLVKDLSLSGFHSQVPERAMKRLCVGDVYEARSRFRDRPFELCIKVAWVREESVGFEFVTLDEASRTVIKSLIRPLKIASSMHRIEADFINASSPYKVWYHGDEDSDLFIWRDRRGFLCGWQFVVAGRYLEWNESKGLETGAMVLENSSESNLLDSKENILRADDVLNQNFIHFTLDVLQALDYEDKSEIIETLTKAQV